MPDRGGTALGLRWGWSVAAAVWIAGCAPPRPSVAPPPTNSPRVGGDQPAPAGGPAVPTVPQRAVTPVSAGLIRLGMTAREARSLPNLNVVETAIALPDLRGKFLRFSQFGLNVALAEVRDGRIARLRVLSPDFATPEGARVGMTVAELEQACGPGTPAVTPGRVRVTCGRTPGYAFLFPGPARLHLTGSVTMNELARRGARVEMILLTGRATPSPGAAPG